MTPIYREMLLDEGLTPVSQLSGAFLNPPSPIHLQFAYYQSSLVIDFLVEKHGADAIKQILSDLGDGLTINDALARNVGSLQKLDAEFSEYARQHAETFGSNANWSRDGLPEQGDLQVWQEWVKEHPNSYWGLRKMAEAYVAAEEFEKAKVPLEKLQQLKAFTGERGDPLVLLSTVYRQLGDQQAEKVALETKVSMSSDALPSLRRLIEISRGGQD